MKLVVNSPESCAIAVSAIKEGFHKGKYLRVSIMRGRDRTLDQNSLFHRWVAILAEKGGEYTFNGYRNFCRLHFFVPVLRAENDEFRAVYDKYIKPMGHTEKLEVIGLMSGVSSACTTEQFSRALEDMQKHYSTLETDPVFLEFEECAEA